MNKLARLDTSEELIVERWQSGVRLVPPDKQFQSTTSIKNLFKLPVNVYFLNLQSRVQNMSETTADLCGFQSKKDAIGQTARAVSTQRSADFSIGHNNEVISRQSIVIKDERFSRLDGFQFQDLAIKFPIMDEVEKPIGIFGFSIILGDHACCSLAESLSLLIQTGLLSNVPLSKTSNNILSPLLIKNPHQLASLMNDLRLQLSVKTNQKFSKREIECLFYLLKGKSASATGIALHLSQRTVEFYLASLKEKLHCRKKSDITDKIGLLLQH